MGKYDLLKPTAKHRRVLIQSFSPDSLQKIHTSASRLPLIQLSTRSDSQPIQATLDAARTYGVGIGPAKDNVDASLVAAAQERCLDIHPYTVNEKVEMRSLIAIGVDSMSTNFPWRLDEVLGSNAVGNDIEAANRAARASEACRKETRAAQARRAGAVRSTEGGTP